MDDARDSKDYKTWRKAVFKRDKWLCRYCGTNRYLEAHHIESYADNKKLRLVKSNGYTLCTSCHDNFHAKYGKGNNNKYQMARWLKSRPQRKRTDMHELFGVSDEEDESWD